MIAIQNFFCIPRKNIISSIVADLPLIQNYRKLLNFLNQIETHFKGILLFSHRGYVNMFMRGYFFRFFSKDIKMKLSSTCGLSCYKPDRQQILVLISQPAFTCSKLTIETLEQGVKYVQS